MSWHERWTKAWEDRYTRRAGGVGRLPFSFGKGKVFTRAGSFNVQSVFDGYARAHGWTGASNHAHGRAMDLPGDLAARIGVAGAEVKKARKSLHHLQASLNAVHLSFTLVSRSYSVGPLLCAAAADWAEGERARLAEAKHQREMACLRAFTEAWESGG